jgi:hypothetical protein
MNEQASKLRAFAISVEQIVRLLPQFAARKAITRGEADHLARQLQIGAESALDIASQLDLATSTTVDEAQVHLAASAMLNSPAWPAVFNAGSAETLARAALSAASRSNASRAA